MPEVITCISCQRKLQVPENLMGQDVQCPTCGGTFLARPDGPAPMRSPDPPPVPSRALVRYRERDDDEDDDYDYERRRRRMRRRRHDYEPHRGGAILALGIVGLVGWFFFAPLGFVGTIGWIMGNYDMDGIRSGRMDPSGEGMVNAGRICGIISTILAAVTVLLVVGIFCLYFLCIVGLFSAAATAPPPRRQGM